MNTIRKIWAAIKTAASYAYTKLIGDMIVASKALPEIFKGNFEPLFSAPLCGVMQLAAIAGIVIGTITSMLVVAVFFPLSIWVAVYCTGAIYLATIKQFLIFHIFSGIFGELLNAIFRVMAAKAVSADTNAVPA